MKDKLYLVLNTQDSEGYWCLNICMNFDTAVRLKEKYINNFIDSGYEECDWIEVQEINLNKDIVWDYEEFEN